MAVRHLVQDTFPRTTATGPPVRVLSYDWHPRQTEKGLQIGLRLHPEDASLVAVGSTRETLEEAHAQLVAEQG